MAPPRSFIRGSRQGQRTLYGRGRQSGRLRGTGRWSGRHRWCRLCAGRGASRLPTRLLPASSGRSGPRGAAASPSHAAPCSAASRPGTRSRALARRASTGAPAAATCPTASRARHVQARLHRQRPLRLADRFPLLRADRAFSAPDRSAFYTYSILVITT